MNNKNLILGLIAIISATTSAFTFRDVNSLTLKDAYVYVKWSSTDNHSICAKTGVQCNVTPGAPVCYLSIVVASGGTKTVLAYDVGCTLVLTHSPDESPISATMDGGEIPYDVYNTPQ